MDNLIRLPRLTFHFHSWRVIKIRSRNGLTKKKTKKYKPIFPINEPYSRRREKMERKDLERASLRVSGERVHFKIKI